MVHPNNKSAAIRGLMASAAAPANEETLYVINREYTYDTKITACMCMC